MLEAGLSVAKPEYQWRLGTGGVRERKVRAETCWWKSPRALESASLDGLAVEWGSGVAVSWEQLDVTRQEASAGRVIGFALAQHVGASCGKDATKRWCGRSW
jgi:hypothetical protein